MKKSTGKPAHRPAQTPGSPIEIMVSTRLSSEDVKKLDACCKELNVSRGAIIRKGIERIYAELKK